ncbi:MAG: FAD/NAD(P)-binding protein [Ectothiorhodospiraceae bacterium]|jgi:NAD(P)H-flavin reductase|nr:FAD/NAD(P)-binding protein [Ectothiorhodospiraceae bacterium]
MTTDINDDLYIPQMGRIVEARPMTQREKYFRLELDRPLGHRPGQFVMVSIPGVGEAAISISCGPRDDNVLEMVVRHAGNVTGAMHRLEAGGYLGIRGPFGSGFHLEEFEGRDVLFVAGGLGLVPLRSLITPIMRHHERYGRIRLISGARTPAETLFRDELKTWNALPNVEVIELVDRTDQLPWDGEVGLVTAPIARLDLDPARTLVALCGPPVMYKFVLMELGMHHRIPREQIFVDLERRMKCGVGKCGHCQINSLYCCKDGPVFRYSTVAALPEALA